MTSLDEHAHIDYKLFEKKLVLPVGVEAPRRLVYEDLDARAISRADLHDDVAGINASLDLIRRTRGGSWPAAPVTEEFNLIDLVWHECEFRDGGSYTYAVYTRYGEYVGCCYLYPLGTRTPLSEALLGQTSTSAGGLPRALTSTVRTHVSMPGFATGSPASFHSGAPITQTARSRRNRPREARLAA